MTSVVTRTPPLTSRVAGRHLPQQPPARTRPKPYNFCNSPGTRPDTPRFILQDVTNVSGVFGNMPQTLSVAPAGPSKQLILKDPSGKTTKTNQHGKRPAEMIDLTHTTGGISEPSSVRKAKKSKSLATNNTATTDAKRKSKTKQERRAEQQEKATVENSAWREKYKTAFPSFVFYFDAIDANTVSGMVKAVQRLGAVRIFVLLQSSLVVGAFTNTFFAFRRWTTSFRRRSLMWSRREQSQPSTSIRRI